MHGRIPRKKPLEKRLVEKRPVEKRPDIKVTPVKRKTPGNLRD